jgi:hypothetical protein
MQQRGKTCWGEGDHDHRANRERGASISYAPPTPRRWWSGTRGTAAPMHLESGRGGAAGCGSRHTPLGGCSGIASGGYRSGQLQQPAAGSRKAAAGFWKRWASPSFISVGCAAGVSAAGACLVLLSACCLPPQPSHEPSRHPAAASSSSQPAGMRCRRPATAQERAPGCPAPCRHSAAAMAMCGRE